MVIQHHVSGYEAFGQLMGGLKAPFLAHVYFTGSKEPTGESWCPDCNQAWPVVEQELDKLPADSHFVVVEVGDRATWKDPSCAFRKDPQTRLLVIPTLKRWGAPQTLEGAQCEKPELVSMLFTHSDDD
ncbi:thioredoxin domain-containing protein 17 [Dendroctonus ponderosae]|uniref:Thioredoxin domain-containing protein 17 n=1 Tax=Dendroctonus ponderosae TaxID=77166 RepID=A0AAR5PG26_DENPD|nr:thioredoxin domain-containing protein 17 [Dendroctonus ponderosae]KAH1000341.1 hypothetical protein HUJ04_000254 [Dendroctonus ponderosae]KAH1003118.1 hypothetical protein HUJ05_011059 [Dendroctonus ponderosae]